MANKAKKKTKKTNKQNKSSHITFFRFQDKNCVSDKRPLTSVECSLFLLQLLSAF